DAEFDEFLAERRRILNDARALKTLSVAYLHQEAAVETTDGAAFGRNYFNRASAPETEDDDERAEVLAEAAALKKLAVDYMHPEVGVTSVDGAAFGRNYFNRASAPETEDDDERADEEVSYDDGGDHFSEAEEAATESLDEHDVIMMSCMLLRALTEAAELLSERSTDQPLPPAVAFMEGLRPHLITILEFVETKLPPLGRECESEVTEGFPKMYQNLLTLLTSSSGVSRSDENSTPCEAGDVNTVEQASPPDEDSSELSVANTNAGDASSNEISECLELIEKQSKVISDLKQRFDSSPSRPVAREIGSNQVTLHIVNVAFSIDGKNGKLALQMISEAAKFINQLIVIVSRSTHHLESANSPKNDMAKREPVSVPAVTSRTDRGSLFRSLDRNPTEVKENTEEAMPPQHIAALAAIREYKGLSEGKKVSIEMQRNFIRLLREENNIALNLNMLWLMIDILQKLTFDEMISGNKKMKNVKALLQCMGHSSTTGSVLNYIVDVLHPGLRSGDDTKRKLARAAMWDLFRALNLTTGTQKLKQKIREVCKEAIDKTITGTGEGDPEVTSYDITSKKFFMNQNGGRKKRRMVVLFFLLLDYSILEVLEEYSGSGESTLNYCKLLCVAPDKLRDGFPDNFFNGYTRKIDPRNVSHEDEVLLKTAWKIVKPVVSPVSDITTRPLLFEHMEEINAFEELVQSLESAIDLRE
ncbi:hypothetical protein ACHAWC_002842, partial [Mediolabrus comicus]